MLSELFSHRIFSLFLILSLSFFFISLDNGHPDNSAILLKNIFSKSSSRSWEFMEPPQFKNQKKKTKRHFVDLYFQKKKNNRLVITKK